MTGTASQTEWAEHRSSRVSMQSLIALRGPSKPRPVTRRNRIEWIVDEEIWRALLQKGKLREESNGAKRNCSCPARFWKRILSSCGEVEHFLPG
jgi:hypothetical protein